VERPDVSLAPPPPPPAGRSNSEPGPDLPVPLVVLRQKLHPVGKREIPIRAVGAGVDLLRDLIHRELDQDGIAAS